MLATQVLALPHRIVYPPVREDVRRVCETQQLHQHVDVQRLAHLRLDNTDVAGDVAKDPGADPCR